MDDGRKPLARPRMTMRRLKPQSYTFIHLSLEWMTTAVYGKKNWNPSDQRSLCDGGRTDLPLTSSGER